MSDELKAAVEETRKTSNISSIRVKSTSKASPVTHNVQLQVSPASTSDSSNTKNETSVIKEVKTSGEESILRDIEPEAGVDFPSYVRFHELDTAITRAIVSLYEEPCKPDNPLLYICQQLGYGLLTPEKIIEVEQKVAALRLRAEELESENEELRNLLHPEEVEKKLDILDDEEIRSLLQREYEDLEIVHMKKHSGEVGDDQQESVAGFFVKPPEMELLGLDYEEIEGEINSPGPSNATSYGQLMTTPVNTAIPTGETEEEETESPVSIVGTEHGRTKSKESKSERKLKKKSNAIVHLE